MSVSLYTIDVGHGLCQVICFSDRRAILIDGGTRAAKCIPERFLEKYVDVIVAYVATHNDADHVGAAPELLDRYPDSGRLEHIWLLFDRPAKAPQQTAHDVIPLLGYAERRKAEGTIRGKHVLYVDEPQSGPTRKKVIHREPREGAVLQLLYPKIMDVSGAFLRGTPNAAATNETSAILRLVVGGPKARAAVLITGDANCRGFELARGTYHFDLSARVLTVPHHGGHIPPSPDGTQWGDVVGWVSPEIAIVSAGHGTPSSTTTQRASFDPLRMRMAKIACTQITQHCRRNYETLHPGVLPPRTLACPQMSGHKEFPKAVGCFGTVAVKMDAAGRTELVDADRHQRAVTAKVAHDSSPLCR